MQEKPRKRVRDVTGLSCPQVDPSSPSSGFAPGSTRIDLLFLDSPLVLFGIRPWFDPGSAGCETPTQFLHCLQERSVRLMSLMDFGVSAFWVECLFCHLESSKSREDDEDGRRRGGEGEGERGRDGERRVFSKTVGPKL